MLSAKHLSRNRENVTVLRDVSLEIQPRKITGVLSLDPGETSTLARILSGHEMPSKGEILLDDRRLPALPSHGYGSWGISLTPGAGRLFPNLSIFDNLVLSIRGVARKGVRISTSKSMALFRPNVEYFQLDKSLDTLAKYLTFEELQKLAIIKCVLEESDFYLIDKVTSSLSIDVMERFRLRLKEIKAEGKGILFIPDNPNQVFDFCDDIVVLRGGKDVFHAAVSEVDVEEIFNILNNTEYTISQAIENKFHQFRANLNKLEILLERSLRVLGNFCGLFQTVAVFREESERIQVLASKYWNSDLPLPHARTAAGMVKTLPSGKKEGFLTWEGRRWFWAMVSPNLEQPALILVQTEEMPDFPFPRILQELRESTSQLEKKLLEEQERKQQEIHSIRLNKEMDIARNIQNSILPKQLAIPGYEISALMETATEVGGDAYDILSTPLGNFIGIGDVSGHGLASGIMALIEMAAFHGVVQTHLSFNKSVRPDIVYDIVNKVLCRINRDRIGSDKFMTKVLLVENEGRFIHAGTHEIGLFYSSKERKIRQLHDMIDRTAFLGISELIESRTSVGEFHMESGDFLLLYTDGLIEAKNAAGEQYGIERAELVLKKHAATGVESIIQELRGDLMAFSKDGDRQRYNGRLADDLTLVLIKKE